MAVCSQPGPARTVTVPAYIPRPAEVEPHRPFRIYWSGGRLVAHVVLENKGDEPAPVTIAALGTNDGYAPFKAPNGQYVYNFEIAPRSTVEFDMISDIPDGPIDYVTFYLKAPGNYAPGYYWDQYI